MSTSNTVAASDSTTTAPTTPPQALPVKASPTTILKRVAMVDIKLTSDDFVDPVPPILTPTTGCQNDGMEVKHCKKLSDLGYGDFFIRKYIEDIDAADFETAAAQVRIIFYPIRSSAISSIITHSSLYCPLVVYAVEINPNWRAAPFLCPYPCGPDSKTWQTYIHSHQHLLQRW